MRERREMVTRMLIDRIQRLVEFMDTVNDDGVNLAKSINHEICNELVSTLDKCTKIREFLRLLCRGRRILAPLHKGIAFKYDSLGVLTYGINDLIVFYGDDIYIYTSLGYCSFSDLKKEIFSVDYTTCSKLNDTYTALTYYNVYLPPMIVLIVNYREVHREEFEVLSDIIRMCNLPCTKTLFNLASKHKLKYISEVLPKICEVFGVDKSMCTQSNEHLLRSKFGWVDNSVINERLPRIYKYWSLAYQPRPYVFHSEDGRYDVLYGITLGIDGIYSYYARVSDSMILQDATYDKVPIYDLARFIDVMVSLISYYYLLFSKAYGECRG